jgi:hypothetical protein
MATATANAPAKSANRRARPAPALLGFPEDDTHTI